MSEATYVFNGVDALSGEYLVAPRTAEDFARLIGRSGTAAAADPLAAHLSARREARLGARYGVDTSNLTEAGWAILFSRDEDPAVIDALAPLIALRRSQAGDALTRVFSGDQGYQPGWTVDDLFALTGASHGPADPRVLPYYVTIVGPPERISFEFQQRLDLLYAVGRICFDTVDEYARYAASVVRAEQRQRGPGRKAYAIVGPSTPGDAATDLSARYLLQPLSEALLRDVPAWTQTKSIGAAATKDTYRALLTGPHAPDLLFSASHGAGFPAGHPRQRLEQGSLVCQGWSGPGHPVTADAQFAAHDLDDADDLTGRIVWLFACYGGGTPELDSFAFQNPRPRIAPRPFVAALPQRMLSLESGALACVAHVDRAWGTSFLGSGREQIEAFRSALHQLIDGAPLGACMEHVNLRYADAGARLLHLLTQSHLGAEVDRKELAVAWTAANDAHYYTVFGDPAVRLTR